MSIVVLYKRTHILRLMTFDRFLVTWFSIATLTAFTNPSLYNAIALLFLAISSVFLLPNNLKERYFSWHKGGVRGAIVLASLIVFCLLVPQVDTDPAKFSVSSIAPIKSRSL